MVKAPNKKTTRTVRKSGGTKRASTAADGALVPPAGGVAIRMYRIGHGDCFLLAFAGKTKPVFMLIDCGYKPGSPQFIDTTAKEVTDDIRAVTGGHIDVAIVTHEHQDHLNGITESNFKDITIGESWFAWTEDPDDDYANALRKRFKDRLLCVLQARQRLALGGAATARSVGKIDELLAFELGGDAERFDAAAAARSLGASGDAGASQNKRAMHLIRDRAEKGVKYLRPHGSATKVPGADGVRVFPLGPPRDDELLHSLMPEEGEGYGRDDGARSLGAYFTAAVRGGDGGAHSESPFARRYRVAWADALGRGRNGFWVDHYGDSAQKAATRTDRTKFDPLVAATDDAAWRRIDHDWLNTSEQLALDMNNDTNNGSLVLAFELSPGGKVLLFAADAQRGNWISWTNGTWRDGTRKKITAQNLLARTVLYKVGHHGSHNATLKGTLKSDYANLDWMAQGDYAGEFTAMITAVRKWAETQVGWDHPLKAIKDALLDKAAGRVFQTDTKVAAMRGRSTKDVWDGFKKNVRDDTLYVDFLIAP